MRMVMAMLMLMRCMRVRRRWRGVVMTMAVTVFLRYCTIFAAVAFHHPGFGRVVFTACGAYALLDQREDFFFKTEIVREAKTNLRILNA